MRTCPNCKNPAVPFDAKPDALCGTCSSHSVRVELKKPEKKEVKKGKK